MDDRPLFEGMDELERQIAPEELPDSDPAKQRVFADEGSGYTRPYQTEEPPAPAPVANMGNAPSAAMAPPNIGNEDHGGAPGDPNTQARYPMDDGSPADRLAEERQ